MARAHYTRRRRSRRRRSRSRRRRLTQRGGASIVHHNPSSEVKVFMCANKSKPTLEALMGSLEKLGYSYEVLAYRMPWENLRAKIQYYLEGAKAHEAAAGPTALAAFVDGFDVLAVLDAATLVKRYREKPRPMPVVFGAEIWCLGNCNKDVIDWYTHHQIRGGRGDIQATFEDFGDGHSVKVPQPTFMNTGFLLGPVGKIRELYEGILATPYEVDDQYTTGVYVQKHFDMIDLDFEERFVRNKLATRDKLPDEGTDAGPVFLHFPGSRDDNDQAALLERFKAYEHVA